jgi:hypothetical protein
MTSQIAIIPPISERQYRPCASCYWYGEDDCNIWYYDYISERNNTHNISFKKRQKLPCRFHLTEDELKQILDPYFME